LGTPLNERHRLHFRPGALKLVADLVQHHNCCFAIVSSMGLFHASPCLRLLLQDAIPGSEWVVDETLDGKWTNYMATYTIKDKQLRWENDVNDQQGDCRETCMDMKYKTERTFVVEWSGEVYTGELTVDGFLKMQTARWGPQIWSKAGRSVPACFVRRDAQGLAEPQGQKRVHIFDSDIVAERKKGRGTVQERTKLPQEELADCSGEHMKEVWSALSECKAGEFSETNTLIIDADKASVSHPRNVLAIMPWRNEMHRDEEKEMGEVRGHVVGLLNSCPRNVPLYLANNAARREPLAAPV
jgi:hypothetical protein